MRRSAATGATSPPLSITVNDWRGDRRPRSGPRAGCAGAEARALSTVDQRAGALSRDSGERRLAAHRQRPDAANRNARPACRPRCANVCASRGDLDDMAGRQETRRPSRYTTRLAGAVRHFQTPTRPARGRSRRPRYADRTRCTGRFAHRHARTQPRALALDAGRLRRTLYRRQHSRVLAARGRSRHDRAGHEGHRRRRLRQSGYAGVLRSYALSDIPALLERAAPYRGR